MALETQRLILRPWQESDADILYSYAKDPQVGPAAGWPVHTSPENSREIITGVLSAKETYAVVLKQTMEPVGGIGLLVGAASNLDLPDNEGEIGYWIGVPFWGQGYIPEAVEKLIDHGFGTLGLDKIWCGYFDGNDKSRRVQEKCGFKYARLEKDKPWPLINAVKNQHITCMERQDWVKA